MTSTTTKSPAEIMGEALEAARNGDYSKLQEIGWEGYEPGNSEWIMSFWPSSLQRFAIAQKANSIIARGSYLLEIATAMEGGVLTLEAEDDLTLVSEWDDAWLWRVATMTDDEILESGEVCIPVNFAI